MSLSQTDHRTWPNKHITDILSSDTKLFIIPKSSERSSSRYLIHTRNINQSFLIGRDFAMTSGTFKVVCQTPKQDHCNEIGDQGNDDHKDRQSIAPIRTVHKVMGSSCRSSWCSVQPIDWENFPTHNLYNIGSNN